MAETPTFKSNRNSSSKRAARSARTAILGIRMTQKRECEVKIEAVRRHLTVADLFDEIWRAYLKATAVSKGKR